MQTLSMRTCRVSTRIALVVAVSLGLFAGVASAQISLTSIGGTYTQDFNTLALTGTSSAVPAGWAFGEVGTAANTTYTAGTGSLNTGDTYSFGATNDPERAFGGLLSGSVNPTIGAQFVNNTDNIINSLSIEYTGEQWRFGAVRTPVVSDRIDFQYSLDATSLTTGTWTDADALDFTSPINTGTAGALNGNAAANRLLVSSSIGALAIPAGGTFWIRWTDFNVASSDDGLAVDDFSITPQATVPLDQTTWGAVKELFHQ